MKKQRIFVALLLATFALPHGQIKEGVHPDWTMEDVKLPKYRVMGLAFLTDGRMVIANTQQHQGGSVPGLSNAANVVLVENISSNDPAQIKTTVISQGWKDVSGINVVDGKVYVADRDGHYVLKAIDNVTDPANNRTKIATWPKEAWHQYVFTPMWWQGKFYAPYSGTIRPGGPSDVPVTSDMSGAFLTWDLTGKMEAYAGGLRSPNGANIDPAGNMFVADNQGSWLPSSTFMHMKPGKFYGHRQSPPHKPNFAEDESKYKYQPPAVWLPQGELRKSPSQPIYVHKGVFQGDWLLGDINHTGLVRIALDKVGDDFQGAVFWFSQGFKSLSGTEKIGVLGQSGSGGGNNPAALNRMVWGPDGNLYLGAFNQIDGNWSDGNPMPMYRMIPKMGSNAFDFRSVRSLAEGVEFGFTKSVNKASLPATLSVKSWHYDREVHYGAGRKDRPNVTFTLDGTSADGLRAHYKADMPIDQVYLFKLGDVKSATGESLWNFESYFTFNWKATRTWDATAVGIADTEKKVITDRNFSVQPLANGTVSVKVDVVGNYTLTLTDMTGKIHARKSESSNQHVEFANPGKSGMYVMHLSFNGASFSKAVYFQ